MLKTVEFALALIIAAWLRHERQATLLGTVKMKFQGCFKWFTTCIVIQAICCSADMGIVSKCSTSYNNKLRGG